MTQDYKAKIGLEVHVQLLTESKMFCRCRNNNDCNDPNTLVCPVCLGLPGALPVLNKEALRLSVIAGQVLAAKVNNFCRFDRKNYFYPDLPKGYQISQLFYPICHQGKLEFESEGQKETVRINRLHLEEDTAKLTHTSGETMMDFNRSGIPLMEIVSEPDLDSPRAARDYLICLRDILVWQNVSRARMQLGEFRCDANISLLDVDGVQQGEVVEIKNINSFRNVEKALEYEYQRQIICVTNNQAIVKETRGFDAVKQETYSQRKKEYAHDYRYFPDPDVPPIDLNEELIERWQAQVLVSDQEVANDYCQKFGIKMENANWLVKNTIAYDVFVTLYNEVKDTDDEKIVGDMLLNIIVNVMWPSFSKQNCELNILTNKTSRDLIKYWLAKKINKEQFGGIWHKIINNEKINLDVLLNDSQVVSESEVLKYFSEFINENPKQIEMMKNEEKIAAVENFFIGFVKRKTEGKADVNIIKKVFAAESKKYIF
ncbi:MAG TPA: Asp-tRNA(Asn)/Glu-tRNA(Gln) amidotransferase subunit GatB [bacterium]|nr:Asp-tRNA(Asn)/Glu-tRNA(Gln) amidotransferase subunit GatB [bacterium]